tara:strand:- start:3013 stop:3225 length:213 start_codon:yes stop_codon:yes gene_type:complete
MSTPKHYESGQNYDIIDVVKHYDLNFNLGNVLKYICRAGKKENEIQDLEKAIEYLERELYYLENDLKYKK